MAETFKQVPGIYYGLNDDEWLESLRNKVARMLWPGEHAAKNRWSEQNIRSDQRLSLKPKKTPGKQEDQHLSMSSKKREE